MINIQPIDLRSVKDGEIINGLIYITDYTPKTDAASKAPIYGTCHYYGKTIGFQDLGRVPSEHFQHQQPCRGYCLD